MSPKSSSPRHQPISLVTGDSVPRHGDIVLAAGDALVALLAWPAPTVIICDGPYGVSGYPGDPDTAAGLAAWYRPHAVAWAQAARPETTLWFWSTELGWASSHPALVEAGWIFRAANTWDKGLARVEAGRAATGAYFPLVTELCVQYVIDPDRATWHPQAGVTNVWQAPCNYGPERLRHANGSLVHPNQKPLALLERIIRASSDPGDVVWEPFGGLVSGSIAAARLGRHAYAAEIHPDYYVAARDRIRAEARLTSRPARGAWAAAHDMA